MNTQPQKHEPSEPSQSPWWVYYERRKAQWIRENPNATPDEYAAAMRQIIKEMGL